jgi:hypothetical protein
LNDAAVVRSYRELMAARTTGGGAMRRRKRLTIVRIGLALATLTMMLPVAAQAKPLPRDSIQVDTQRPEIPYLSQGVGVSEADLGIVTSKSPDDRSLARTYDEQRAEIPYLSHGVGVSEAELGIASSNSPDDRAFARTTDEQPVLVSDSSFDVNPYAVTGFGLMLVLMAGGMGLAIRHNRKSRLAPA